MVSLPHSNVAGHGLAPTVTSAAVNGDDDDDDDDDVHYADWGLDSLPLCGGNIYLNLIYSIPYRQNPYYLIFITTQGRSQLSLKLLLYSPLIFTYWLIFPNMMCLLIGFGCQLHNSPTVLFTKQVAFLVERLTAMSGYDKVSDLEENSRKICLKSDSLPC